MFEIYRRKVAMLIEVMPILAEEPDLAMHGGTAINLFVREMPRLSVDIDMTYLPIADRETSLEEINKILIRLKLRIERKIKGSIVHHDTSSWKLIISKENINVKLEINTVIRGVIADPIQMKLCSKAQEEFEAFVEMNIVPFGQLYGGKICAALDRQHPRDLFDVKYLLQEEGISDKVLSGFIFSLASSNRPMHDLLKPNFLDQRKTMDNQFAGMSIDEFNYKDFEDTRANLVTTIHSSLTEKEKAFLLSLMKLTPDWSIYNFEHFPAIQWKLHNLRILEHRDKDKYHETIRALEQILEN